MKDWRVAVELACFLAVLWPTDATGQEQTVELLLRISPPLAEVALDDAPVQLTEHGKTAFVRVAPGRHVLVVKKPERMTLEKVIEVPADGLTGAVRLAPTLPWVTVQLKSGRVMQGGLISRDNGRITVTRGKGKVTLTERMCERIEVGAPAPIGASTLRVDGGTPSDSPTKGLKSGTNRLPRKLRRAVTIPDGGRDQHGNPVIRRDGSALDPKTRRPYEIWLKEPVMELVLVTAGRFVLGEGGREAPVQLKQPFYIGKYEVTQAQYQKVMGSNPSVLSGATRPVDSVRWDAAQAFCRRLSKKGKHQFCLPTERQWEMAARGTDGRPYPWGSEQPTQKHAVSFMTWNNGTTRPVGGCSAGASPFGCFDMTGNVWEWCKGQVLRGGCFKAYPKEIQTLLKATSRWERGPDQSYMWKGVGFRIAIDE